MYVYSLGAEYCTSSFIGDEVTALANGYKYVSDYDYAKLCDHTAHWVNGNLEYREKTAEEIAEEEAKRERAEKDAEISELKNNLAKTDYAVIKIAEGSATADGYADVIAQRRVWRNRINELEA